MMNEEIFAELQKQHQETEFKPDSIVQAVIQRFKDRAKFGKKKYNTDLDRTDLTLLEWIEHAQNELHDGILYLEKLKKVFCEKEIPKSSN